ncbi:DUF305 domain-containing protein [Brevundimonas sp. CEF1]|jgi:hypothetical protein|uniref:DUF305 domain-containing protein n=1 Tax=Brevundimonas sp. CEF1 TaxID=3442642 RepID=UPI003F50F962
MKRLSWLTLIAAFLAAAAFLFGMMSRQSSADRPAAAAVQPIDEHAGHADAPGDTPSTRSFKEANEHLHQATDIRWTGDADVDFMRAMIAHHEGEIALARIQLQHGSDKDARGLAQDLIRARDTEILRMRLWLARRETQPAPKSGA